MITVLSGGTGSIKIIRGLARIFGKEVAIIVNVGDNIWFNGFYVCPDVDTIIYGLTNLLDVEKGWGIRGDTFNFLNQLEKFNLETWFRIGDKDLATHVLRLNHLRSGLRLSQIIEDICRRLDIKLRIIPATDAHIETRIITEHSEMHFQEFWVKKRGVDRVLNVLYKGVDKAKPAQGVIDAIMGSDQIIICPANPISSIGPILAIHNIRKALRETKAPVVTVSPIIGGAPISGPAGELMRASGIDVSALGVAKFYSDFLNMIVIDVSDANLRKKIEKMGIKVETANILMRSPSDEDRIAGILLSSIKG